MISAKTESHCLMSEVGTKSNGDDLAGMGARTFLTSLGVTGPRSPKILPLCWLSGGHGVPRAAVSVATARLSEVILSVHHLYKCLWWSRQQTNWDRQRHGQTDIGLWILSVTLLKGSGYRKARAVGSAVPTGRGSNLVQKREHIFEWPLFTLPLQGTTSNTQSATNQVAEHQQNHSLATFRRLLKTHLSRKSFPGHCLRWKSSLPKVIHIIPVELSPGQQSI